MKKVSDLLVGLGGAGRRFLEGYSSKENLARLYIDSDQESLRQSFGGERLWLPIEELVIGGSLSEVSLAKIHTITKRAECLFLVAGLGGTTGTRLLSELIHVAGQLNTPVVSIVFIPFSFEREARRKALECIDELRKGGQVFRILDLNKILQGADNNCSLNELLFSAHVLAGARLDDCI